MFCLSIGYQHTEAVGSLQDWDLTLHPDCQRKIEYHCFISSHFNVCAEAKPCGAFLSKSLLVGDGSEAQRIGSYIQIEKGQNNKLSYGRQ